jgi:PAS domain S-box-containing protein
MLPDFRLRQREYLLQISQAMSSKLELFDLLKLILGNAVQLIAGQAGLIVLRHASGHLTPLVSINLPREIVPLFSPLWENIPADEANTIPDIRQRLAMAARASQTAFRQVVALPLNIEEQNLGYIFVFREKGSASFTSNDNQVLSTFANHASIAVHNAYLYRQVNAERERLNAIIENSGDGVMIINKYRIIRTWNQTLANMTGISAEEAIGRPCYDVLDLHTRQGTSLCHTQCPIMNPPENGHLYIEGYHERLDGVEIVFADKYSAQPNDEGEAAHFIANVRDVTSLREADDLKQTLLAVISHELKTPISIIKGYAGTLAREDANWDTATLRDGLQIIEEEADKLNDLITNFLEASRLQAGSVKLKLSPIYLPDLVKTAVKSLAVTTSKHQFGLKFPANYPTIPGDYDRLSQVITNLINNAIKYSPKGGQIEIGGRFTNQTTPPKAELYVRDEGIGIPAHQQEQIFERFHRVDNGLTRKTPGTGLGLFLTKSVVMAHGGSVWVESQPGAGSTFWLALPVDEADGGVA